MKTIEQQLAKALNEPTTSPAFAIFSGQPLAKADTKPMYSSRARIREALADADIVELERIRSVVNEQLEQLLVVQRKTLAITDITAKLYTQYQEYWCNKYETFAAFLVAFKGGKL